MAQQTALEIFIEMQESQADYFISKQISFLGYIENLRIAKELCKELEKEQMLNAYKSGLAGMLPEGVNKMTITRVLE